MEPNETSPLKKELLLVYFNIPWCICLGVRAVGALHRKGWNGRMFRKLRKNWG